MQLANVRGMPARPRKTPLRPLSVDADVWTDFGEAATTAGTTRPDALREFIDWVRRDPELWAAVRAEADRRGEAMWAVVLRQLRAYLDDRAVEPPAS